MPFSLWIFFRSIPQNFHCDNATSEYRKKKRMKRLHIFQEKIGTGTWFWLETIYFIEFTGYGIVLIFKEIKCFTLVTDSFRSNVRMSADRITNAGLNESLKLNLNDVFHCRTNILCYNPWPDIAATRNRIV